MGKWLFFLFYFISFKISFYFRFSNIFNQFAGLRLRWAVHFEFSNQLGLRYAWTLYRWMHQKGHYDGTHFQVSWAFLDILGLATKGYRNPNVEKKLEAVLVRSWNENNYSGHGSSNFQWNFLKNDYWLWVTVNSYFSSVGSRHEMPKVQYCLQNGPMGT